MTETTNRDAALEAQIITATLRLQTASTPRQRREHWAQLQALVAQRSAERVATMERERGLVR